MKVAYFSRVDQPDRRAVLVRHHIALHTIEIANDQIARGARRSLHKGLDGVWLDPIVGIDEIHPVTRGHVEADVA